MDIVEFGKNELLDFSVIFYWKGKFYTFSFCKKLWIDKFDGKEYCH